nr:retrotransposon protein, putative, Ty1-copia subclass [Tanacetum cinerariifolium]
MLQELKTLFAQQAEQELLQTMREFHSCKQDEGHSVSSYVLKMKSYIDNLERLGNPVTTGLAVSLILISLRKEFDGFVQNYNMHSMRKTINELHAMLKLHEQTLPKNNAPALHTIRLRGSRKLKPGSLSLYVGNGQRAGVEAIGSYHLSLPKGLVIVLNNCHYAPYITRGIISVFYSYDDGYVNQFVDNSIQVSRNNMVYFSAVPRDARNTLRSCNMMDFSIQLTIWLLKNAFLVCLGCEALVKRDTLTKPDKLKPRSIKCIFIGYPKETMSYSFYYPPENKVLVAWNAEFLENSLITQEASGSLEDLEIIQEEDTQPSIDTSLNHEEDDLEIDEPQSDIIPIRRSTRTRHAPDHPESNKWLKAMNVEMQSMKENKVWDLVDLPPNEKNVGSKWLFKKKTDMDGAVHTYKARLVAKGYTQTPRTDYEKTFSPVADIRAIRILIAIAAFYDYEI